MAMSRYQNAVKNNNLRTGNKSFERMENFKYLGMTVTAKIAFMKKLRGD
jgi:hypothetical protein